MRTTEKPGQISFGGCIPVNELDRQGIWLSPEISFQHFLEDGTLLCDGYEEGHAGPKFVIVRIAEDLGGGFSADSEQALRALTETMAEGWVREIGARLGYRPDSVKNLSIYARKLILAHSWPRIRELYQTLVRGVIWTRGEQIEAADIRAAVLPVPTHSRSRSRFDRSVTQGSDLESLVDEVKTHYIRLALKKCGGKKIVAARLLGFSNHQTLGYWIKRLGITSEDLA